MLSDSQSYRGSGRIYRGRGLALDWLWLLTILTILTYILTIWVLVDTYQTYYTYLPYGIHCLVLPLVLPSAPGCSDTPWCSLLPGVSWRFPGAQ